VAVGEFDEVWRAAVAAAYLDDFTVPVAGPDRPPVYEDPITHGCLHH
jgi:hypothetical protein